MISISLCMIVRDEEDVLERCLNSVYDIVDEIIIADTGSTDRSREIAQRFTEHVLDFPWVDDFAAARNFSFAQAGMDYIMWLDADDVLPENSRLALMQLKEQLTADIDVVMMPYHMAFDENDEPRFVYERERLLKNHAGFSWKGAVHEAITPSGKIIHAPQVVIQHRKLKNSDPDRNLRIFEKQLAKGVQFSPRERFYYARELYYHQQYKQAIDEFNKFLDMQGGWLENRLDAYRLLATCMEKMEQPQTARRVLLGSLNEDVPRAEICCHIGRLFLQEQNYRAAAFWYETAANCIGDSSSGAFVDPDCYDYIPYMQLVVCYYHLGNMEKSYNYHLRAQKLRPNAPAVCYNQKFFETCKSPVRTVSNS